MSGRGGKRDYGGFLSNSSSSSTKERLALLRDDSPAIDAGREEEEEAIQQFELLLEREREREQERRVTTRAESPTRPVGFLQVPGTLARTFSHFASLLLLLLFILFN